MKSTSKSIQMAITGLLLCLSIVSKLGRAEPELEQRFGPQEAQQVSSLDGALADQFLQSAGSYQPRSPLMQLRKLNSASNNITCNDGSPIGYYERLNSHSKSWVIYLQGGGFCAGQDSCQQRWQRSAHLMSSNYWPKTKTVDGILSNEPKDNPYLWNANHIYLPYCSSDSWSGSAPASGSGPRRGSPFAFMGSRILERVLESLYDDLPRNSSLHESKFILLAGDSAGATGVILNLDKVNALVERRSAQLSQQCTTSGAQLEATQPAEPCEPKQAPVLRGLADSGWFLDNEPYDYDRQDNPAGSGEPKQDNPGLADNEYERQLDCDFARCSPSQSVRQAMGLWSGQVPDACAGQHPNEPWRCYFGYRAYQTLRTPLFVVQWLYDEAQLMVDNIARPDTSGQWNYVNKMVNEMRASLENVTALFAPSCLAHSLITRNSWNQININGFKLPHVLNSWEEQSLLETTSSSAMKATHQVARPTGSEAHQAGAHRGLEPAPASLVPQVAGERQQVGAEGLAWLFVDGAAAGQSSFEASALDSANGKSHWDQTVMQPTTKASQSPQEPQRSPVHRTHAPGSSGPSKPKNRKRRRNNHQQRAKQIRQKAQPQPLADLLSTQTEPKDPTRDSMNNDLSQVQNPLQELLPFIDQSLSSEQLFSRLIREPKSPPTNLVNGRLGRSTLVDDATLMLSNNMPDDNSATTQITSASSSSSLSSEQHRWIRPSSELARTNTYNGGAHIGGGVQSRFRLIDLCGWPQCNRDCPMMDSDFNSARFIQF